MLVGRNTQRTTLEFTYLLEVVTDLKLALLGGDVGLNFSVCVVNDGQEHVEQDKEHEEDIGDEEDWTKDTIGSLQSMEVEITQDDTEQCKATRKNNNQFQDQTETPKNQNKRIQLECKAFMPAMCNASINTCA